MLRDGFRKSKKHRRPRERGENTDRVVSRLTGWTSLITALVRLASAVRHLLF